MAWHPCPDVFPGWLFQQSLTLGERVRSRRVHQGSANGLVQPPLRPIHINARRFNRDALKADGRLKATPQHRGHRHPIDRLRCRSDDDVGLCSSDPALMSLRCVVYRDDPIRQPGFVLIIGGAVVGRRIHVVGGEHGRDVELQRRDDELLPDEREDEDDREPQAPRLRREEGLIGEGRCARGRRSYQVPRQELQQHHPPQGPGKPLEQGETEHEGKRRAPCSQAVSVGAGTDADNSHAFDRNSGK